MATILLTPKVRFVFALLLIIGANTLIWAEGTGDGGIMSPKIGLSFWTIVTFLFVMIVLKFTAWKPLLASLEKRENAIKEALENASKAQANAEKVLKEYQEQIANAQAEVKTILDQARKAGDDLKNNMLREANQEANRIRERNENEIKLAKDKAISEVFRVAADLSLAMSAKFVQKSLSNNEQSRIVQETIEDFKRMNPRN